MNLLTVNEYADKSKEHYLLGIHDAEKKYKELSSQELDDVLRKLQKQHTAIMNDEMEKQYLAGKIHYVSKRLTE
ncbi:MAG: hypothetical protein ACPG4Y_05540 [Chitinophagales bacterium]